MLFPWSVVLFIYLFYLKMTDLGRMNYSFRKNDPVSFLRRVDFLLLAVLIYLIYLKFDCSEHP